MSFSSVNAIRPARRGGTRRMALLVASLGMSPSLIALIVDRLHSSGRAAPAEWPSAIFCIAGCVIALVLISRLLRPIGAAAKAVGELSAKAELGDATQPLAGELADMINNIDLLTSRFEGLRSRLHNRHPGTGLSTREPFLAELTGDMERSTAPTLLALVRLCDFDRMSAFDRQAADAVIKAFGARLQGAVRDNLSLAQVDRDCFAIWFRSTPVEAASDELRAIAYVLEQDICVDGQNITPVIAAGAALYPRDAADAVTLLSCAFAAAPKTAQAPSLAFFSPTATEADRKRYLMEQHLRNAIAADQFQLHYQPVVDLAQARAVGAEALLRWRHPDFGAVSPAEFVPILEQSGLIDEVGLWVLNTACREARAWRVGGLKDLRMAVNLSAAQFRTPSLVMVVARMLERHRLTPDDLELELTETAAMQDSARTLEMLEQFQALGVRVAIDDFGAGYSSLSYLKNLPFTKLKIDREFVVKVHERPNSQAICAALIALARGLNIELLAEGVEEREEVETLVALGCSKFQGYFFARPLPASQFARTVSDPDWLARLGLDHRAADTAARRRA
jgi:EAL domain-containing protein (putative c-di-GMP-specific phosphodiesterase class I)/GGDEF domain-containing protein